MVIRVGSKLLGRLVFRGMRRRPEDFGVVAIHGRQDAKGLSLLLKYDSVHGRLPARVRRRPPSSPRCPEE